MRHRFIVIEGLDCVGKSTVSKLLAGELGARLTQTPGPPYSDVKDGIDNKVGVTARFLFFLSSVVAASEEIVETLKRTDVVCDRYVNTTFAYHRALGVETELIDLDLLPVRKPDFAFYLTASEEVRLERGRGRSSESRCDRWLEENQALQQKIAEDFAQMGMVTIDTSLLTPGEVVDVITVYLEGGG